MKTFFKYLRQLQIIFIIFFITNYNIKKFKAIVVSARYDKVNKEFYDYLRDNFYLSPEQEKAIKEVYDSPSHNFVFGNTWYDLKYRFRRIYIIDRVRDLYYTTKYGIENILIWFKVIWKDRDWDSYYFFVIMKKKIERMKNLQENYGHSVESENIAKNMDKAIKLIDKLVKDDYDSLNYDEKIERYGRSIMSSTKNENTHNYTVNFTKEDGRSKCKKEIRETREAFIIAAHEKQRDTNLLFKLLSKEIHGWWD
jgi:hypothetical protein